MSVPKTDGYRSGVGDSSRKASPPYALWQEELKEHRWHDAVLAFAAYRNAPEVIILAGIAALCVVTVAVARTDSSLENERLIACIAVAAMIAVVTLWGLTIVLRRQYAENAEQAKRRSAEFGRGRRGSKENGETQR